MRHRIVPLLKAARKEALRSRDVRLARACKDLLREAVAEGREHRCLRDFYRFGCFTLANAGLVGRVLLILYAGGLFSSKFEQQRCVLSSLGRVQESDLELIVTAASRLRELDCSPAHDDAISQVLKRVCLTDYFLQEDLVTASRVVKKVVTAGADQSETQQTIANAIVQAYHEADYIHYDSKKCHTLDFGQAKKIHRGVATLEPVELLEAIKHCSVLDKLVTRRPRQSVMPHAEAVMGCIEHAVLWLQKSKLRIFYPLAVTYEDVPAKLSAEDEGSLRKFWDVRIPSPLERELRLVAINDRAALMTKGDLHYVKGEDYDRMIPFLLDTLSSKELEVLKMLAFPYRSTAENLEYERNARCASASETLEYRGLEPSQYRYLFK